MMPSTPDAAHPVNGDRALGSVADELERESDRLRQLADELKLREAALAECNIKRHPYHGEWNYEIHPRR